MCEIKNKLQPAMHIQIGKSTYIVGINFNQDAKETLDEKLNRLIKRDVMEKLYEEN